MTLGLLLIGLASIDARGQSANRVKISVASPSEIRIQMESFSPTQSWSFRNAYAGVLGLAERVEQFRAFANGGKELSAKKIATGEFRSVTDATAISYVVRLSTPRASSVSHVSWVAGASGFLMLADLIPENSKDLLVELSLPGGWSSQSTIEPDAQGNYHVAEPEKAVFFVGRSLRKETKRVEGMTLECIVDGQWPFKDAVALKSASRVLERYFALTGFRLAAKPVVMIAPLPVAVGSVKWRAETRGSTVVLLMDPNATIRNWAGQLGIIFTHEVLHLWVPNSLPLQGDYDWFFEGFTLYTALVTALELKFINFDEYLATLARVYDSYLSYPDGLSLIDASERRWTSGNSVVYDKGMLVAFLYDLVITKESDSRTRLADRYRELFGSRATEPANGNDVIIGLLSSAPATADFAKAYVEGSKELELERVLSAYGLRLDTTGTVSRLTVDKKIQSDQKRLLRSLGYR